jgi:ribosomal protein S18 acetylase RimI-like enzyme
MCKEGKMNNLAALEEFRREDVIIRATSQSDLPTIIALDTQAFGSERPAYYQQRLATYDPANPETPAVFLTADYHDVVVGFVMGTLAYGEFGLPQITAFIDSIAVYPKHQRRGIGQRLIEEFIEESGRRGAASVYTLVNWDNWLLLKAFHSLGFSLAKSVPL